MSSLPTPFPAHPNHAYPAPWRLGRSLPPPWYRLEHHGFEPSEALTVTLLGSARLIAVAPGRLEPGQSIRFAIRGPDPAIDSILVVRWLTPQNEEYLWRASF